MRSCLKTIGSLFWLFLLAGPAASPALAQCPNNTIDVCGAFVSNAPSYSASGCGLTSIGTGSYNLPSGMVSAQSDADYPDGYGNAHVITDDVYRLVGPPTSALISFSADLHAHGQGSSYFCTSASGSATLQSGTSHQTATFHGSSCQGEGVDKTLSLPQLRSVGESFDLIMDVVATASAGASAAMDGNLSFSGLPPGYSIESCQGYLSTPTPSRPLSWGRLKLRYR
jgi:hypothetical protein